MMGRLFTIVFFLDAALSPLVWAHPCDIFFKIPVADLTSYVRPQAVEGLPITKNRWLLGDGTEGRVERVLTRDGRFSQVKTFFEPELAEPNFELIQFLESFHIQSFKTLKGTQIKNGKHISPWIPGVSLLKLLKNAHIPKDVRDELFNIYQVRLVVLLRELCEKRPDLIFEVNYGAKLKAVLERMPDHENLDFRALPNNAPDEENYRFMIVVFDRADLDNEHNPVLEPKIDNIVVDLKTWDMTWIDPN